MFYINKTNLKKKERKKYEKENIVFSNISYNICYMYDN